MIRSINMCVYMLTQLFFLFIFLQSIMTLFKQITYFTLILFISLISISQCDDPNYIYTRINYLCSDYCGNNNCTGNTNADCNGSCVNNFTTSGSSCVIDTTQYTILFEQTVNGSSSFSNTSQTTCGNYHINGIFTAGTLIVVYNQTITQPHYKMRLMAFILFIDTDWSFSNTAFINLNGTQDQQVKQNFGCGGWGNNNDDDIYCYYIANQCGTSDRENGTRLDSGDFSDSSTTVNVTIGTNSSGSGKLWGFNQFIMLIRVCNAACLTCDGPLISDCQSCAFFGGIQYLLYQSTCYVTCPSKTYQNSSTTCAACSSKCTSCNGTSSTNCTLCTLPNYLNPDYSCDNNCPSGYFEDSTDSSNPVCTACDPSCTSCTGNPSPCSACNTTQNFYLYNNVCYNPCPTATYINNGNCANCNNNCTACSQSANNCSACATNFLYLASNNTCPSNCPSNYYNDTTTCYQCPSTCATCTSMTTCLTCTSGNYLYNAACSSTCPSGYYTNTSLLQCIICNTNCTVCTNTADNCSACATGFVYVPLNNTCPSSCPSDYYLSSGICYICQSNCSSCTGNPTPCLTCIINNYLYNSTCLSTCPNGTYASGLNCEICDPSCTICSGSSTNCTGCASGYVLVGINNTCLSSCPSSFYYVSSNNTCYACSPNCSVCTGYPTPCSICNSGYFLFLGIYCGTTCPNPYFMNNYTNTCELCNSNCTICSGYSTNCSACATGYYLYNGNNSCSTSCPTGFVADANTLKCVDCTSSNSCVGLSINMYIASNNNNTIYVDMNFTQNLNFTLFPYQSFQSIYFGDSTFSISSFTITYNITSSSSYRIILVYSNYAMIYNEPLYTLSISKNQSYYSTNGSIFLDSDFNQQASLNWTYVNMTPMAALDNNIATGLSTVSVLINGPNTPSWLQSLQRFGFILLIFNSLQITSCLVLINVILPQNLYEGVRVMAQFIFYAVPPYEQDLDKQIQIMGNAIKSIIPNYSNRRILTMNEFNFHRTGFSTYFLLDSYPQMIAIGAVYLTLITCLYLTNKFSQLQKLTPYLFTTLHKFHEIAILYFTLTVYFEFAYFSSDQPIRWISIIFCIIINIYFIAYYAYKYYDMMKYPTTQLQTQLYLSFVNKYGSMLRYIRYEQYNNVTTYLSLRYWFRPYNYHILSFVKKFLMMFSFTLFYATGSNQILALICCQSLEIVRFCLTWPFVKKWMNIYRLCLQIILFIVFILVLVIDNLVKKIQSAPSSSLFNSYVITYYRVGWATLAFVILFNLGFFILYAYDLYMLCRYSNKELMDQNRKQYFKQKYSNYQKLDQNSFDIKMMNRMIQQGLIEPLKFEDLPKIQICIQNYRIWNIGSKYEVALKKICRLRMNTVPIYTKDNNNIKPVKIIQKTIWVTKKSSFCEMIKRIEHYTSNHQYSSMIIKNYLQVDQSLYHGDDEIKFIGTAMKTEIYIQNDEVISKQPIYQGKLLPGFPISEKIIQSITEVEDNY